MQGTPIGQGTIVLSTLRVDYVERSVDYKAGYAEGRIHWNSRFTIDDAVDQNAGYTRRHRTLEGRVHYR